MLRPGNPYTKLCQQALLVALPEAYVVFPKVCLSAVSIMHANPADVTDPTCILQGCHATALSIFGRAASLSLYRDATARLLPHCTRRGHCWEFVWPT